MDIERAAQIFARQHNEHIERELGRLVTDGFLLFDLRITHFPLDWNKGAPIGHSHIVHVPTGDHIACVQTQWGGSPDADDA